MGKLVVNQEDIFLYDELLDLNTRNLAKELAFAVDNNSVPKIKELKYEYGKSKEFLNAKKFLNKKCKQVWNPFDTNNPDLPAEAMKCLGITNQPSLDFLLYDSVKYFEKSNGDMTVKIIKSILTNKNLSYNIEDIHKYLAVLIKKENCKLSTKTAQYLIIDHNYNKQKLTELKIDIKEILHSIPVVERIKYLYKLK